MIDHIEQYLKQHHCRDYYNLDGDLVEDDHYFMYREEVDGLIELIVRECVGQGRQVQSQKITNGSEEYIAGREAGIEVFMNHIMNHFGVKP